MRKWKENVLKQNSVCRKKTTFTDAMLDGLAYTVKNHMHDCENLITELDELAISLLSCKSLKTTTINVPRIEEKISIYRNSVSRTAGVDT